MKNLTFLLTSFALLASPVLAVDASAPISAPTLDPLAEVLPVLQASYADFAALHYKTGDQLGDLIARADGQIVLDSLATAPTPILTTLLPNGVLYLRLATFAPKKDWSDLANDLRQTARPAAGVVLDLRSNMAPDDYAGAAQIADIFAPSRTALVPYVVSQDVLHSAPYFFQGPIIVIVNRQTTGAAAELAACLRINGALVVGQPTSVTASFFDEHKFSNGQVLRFVAAPPSGLPAVVAMITPDITMAVDSHNEKAALALIREDRVLEVIEESTERRRMSEASLVQGQDPEWDDYLTSLENGPVLLSLPHIHDPVLITALDSLRAIRFSQEPVTSQTAANASTPAPSSL